MKCFFLLICRFKTLEFGRFDEIVVSNNRPSRRCAKQSYSYCYIAGNFFSTARGLIGYFEVTWHLTMKLLSGQHCKKSMTSGGNNAMLPANVDQWPPLQRGLMNFQLHNFQLYNKSPIFSCVYLYETLPFVYLSSLRKRVIITEKRFSAVG